jgi:MEMO1 family protein
MHLPYIKKVFGDKEFSLVPLMVGDLPLDKVSDYARALLPLFKDERTLFIVSSDFCHWGSNFDYYYMHPEEPVIHKSIEKLDKAGMAQIEAQSVKQF